MLDRILLLTLFGSGAWMTAISWFVGAVHYPGFHSVDPARWAKFHEDHTRRIGPIVGMPMIAQGVATALICIDPEFPIWLKVAVLVAGAFSIGWTGVVSGPLHVGLTQTPPERLNRLISTNWVRTVAWGALTLIAGYALLV